LENKRQPHATIYNGNYSVNSEDISIMHAIRFITRKGNDAEVKLKADGKLKVYEIKRTSYP